MHPVLCGPQRGLVDRIFVVLFAVVFLLFVSYCDLCVADARGRARALRGHARLRCGARISAAAVFNARTQAQPAHVSRLAFATCFPLCISLCCAVAMGPLQARNQCLT